MPDSETGNHVQNMIFEHSPDGIIVIDRQGIITDCNERFTKIVKKNKVEIISREIHQFLNQKDVDIWQYNFDSLQNGEIIQFKAEIVDTNGRKKTFRNFIVGMFDGDRLTSIAIYCRDISRLTNTQSELQVEKEYYQTFMENMDDWAWEMNKEGFHTYSNRAVEKILGYTVNEVVGKHTTFMWLDEYKTEWEINNLEKYLKSGIGWKNFPAVFRKKTGEKVYLESTAVPIFEDNELIGYRGIDRDITDRRKMADNLQKHQEHLKLINRILRHDLTNYLMNINSALNIYNKTDEAGYLKEITNNVKRSFNLIDRMRKLELYVNNDQELSVIDLNLVLKEVIRSYPGITFSVSGKARIMADSTINSVIDNIVRNAVVHGETDKIDMLITRSEHQCELKIIDYGKGISEKFREKIFDENFKYGKKAHTGLGLYIVKKAMEKYQGNVHAEANEPNGSIIVLSFKLVN